MTDATRLEEIADEAREQWVKAVTNHGEYAEWKPTVFALDEWATGARLRAGAVLEVEVAEGQEVSSMLLGLSLAEQLVTAATTWVAIVVDTYATADPTLMDLVVMGALPPLSSLYQIGWPGVHDALVVNACSRDGVCAVVTSPYHRPTAATIEWGEFETVYDTEHRLRGTMPDALRTLMARSGN